MRVVEEVLNGVKLLEPKVFKDERGYFTETYNKSVLKGLIGEVDFVQDNQSLSQKGVLRGLHFQNPPCAQGKLVRVMAGEVQDVVVDLRKDSSTYGMHYSVVLSSDNFLSLWIPPGFAHGFLTLKDDTVFCYKVSGYYNKESEGCIKWNDSSLAIPWMLNQVSVSKKDQEGVFFEDLSSLF